jgi:hypothetical protein
VPVDMVDPASPTNGAEPVAAEPGAQERQPPVESTPLAVSATTVVSTTAVVSTTTSVRPDRCLLG